MDSIVVMANYVMNSRKTYVNSGLRIELLIEYIELFIIFRFFNYITKFLVLWVYYNGILIVILKVDNIVYLILNVGKHIFLFGLTLKAGK